MRLANQFVVAVTSEYIGVTPSDPLWMQTSHADPIFGHCRPNFIFAVTSEYISVAPTDPLWKETSHSHVCARPNFGSLPTQFVFAVTSEYIGVTPSDPLWQQTSHSQVYNTKGSCSSARLLVSTRFHLLFRTCFEL